MQRVILIVIFSFSSALIFAQDYIVTLQKDTIKGEVTIPLPQEFVEEVKIEKVGDKEIYKAYQVLSVFADTVFYQPVKLNNIYRLMEVVEPGYLTLYLYRPDQSYEFSNYYLQKKSLEGIELPNISFRKVMTQFLDDCPSVVKKIEDRTYRKNDIIEIVAEYNICLADLTVSTQTEETEVTSEKTVGEEHPAVVIIRGIQAKIDSDNRAELATLLADIKGKLNQGKPVPGYLKSALKEQTAGINNIQKEVEELLNAID